MKPENKKIKEKIIKEFNRYLQWEQGISYHRWEEIELYIADTLSEAWVLARPDDVSIFLDDNEYKEKIDGRAGKWLEPKRIEPYKIILSTKYGSDIQQLMKEFIYQLRKCLDYKKAKEIQDYEETHWGFSYCDSSQYYVNWSNFKATYAMVRYEYFAKCEDSFDNEGKFNILSEILGKYAAQVTAGLMTSKDDLEKTLYFISRYIGVSRAIRNINMEEEIDGAVFHIWTLTPHYIIENYGYVFYLGNEWDDMDFCELTTSPESGDYYHLVESLKSQYQD